MFKKINKENADEMGLWCLFCDKGDDKLSKSHIGR